MKRLLIRTKDTAFFERLCKGAADPVPGIVCVSGFPRKKEPRTAWAADMSPAGRTAETVPADCDAALVAAWTEDGGGCLSLCKYRQKTRLLEDLRALCAEDADTSATEKESSTRVVLCTSASGGCGTTTAAAGLALAAGARGFYLNLEPVAGDFPFSAEEGPDFGTVLFRLRMHLPQEKASVLSAVATDRRGVSFFRPPRNPEDMGGVTGGTLSALLDILRQSGKYDRIVVDCPFAFSETFSALSEAADAVFLVRKKENAKHRALLAWLKKAFRGAVRELCRDAAETDGLCLPDFGELPREALLSSVAEYLAMEPLFVKND